MSIRLSVRASRSGVATLAVIGALSSATLYAEPAVPFRAGERIQADATNAMFDQLASRVVHPIPDYSEAAVPTGQRWTDGRVIRRQVFVINALRDGKKDTTAGQLEEFGELVRMTGVLRAPDGSFLTLPTVSSEGIDKQVAAELHGDGRLGLLHENQSLGDYSGHLIVDYVPPEL